jgi:RNA-directed DNA polymerase
MALDDMFDLLKNHNLLKGKKVNLIRYADHFVITGNDKTLLEQIVQPLMANFLQERGLRRSPPKTKISHIDQGFDFLGQNIKKYRGKLLIKPSKGSCKRLLEKVKRTLKSNKTAKQSKVISLLNPLIRGWSY